MKQIHVITEEYGLTEAEKAALDGVLYGIKEYRTNPSNSLALLRKGLNVSMSIRGNGLCNFDEHYTNLVSAYRKFMRINGGIINANRNASVGHKEKRKRQVHGKVNRRSNAFHHR